MWWKRSWVQMEHSFGVNGNSRGDSETRKKDSWGHNFNAKGKEEKVHMYAGTWVAERRSASGCCYLAAGGWSGTSPRSSPIVGGPWARCLELQFSHLWNKENNACLRRPVWGLKAVLGVKAAAPGNCTYRYLFIYKVPENADFVCLRLFQSFGPGMVSGSELALHKHLLK